MEFSRSQRNNEVMKYLGFEYLASRTYNGIVTWRCRQNRATNCHSNMKLKDGVIVQEPTDHCHDSCPQKADANIIRCRMRRDMKTLAATPHNVIGEALSGVNNDVLAHIPKPSSLSRSLLYHKTNKTVSNPTSASFDIPDKYTSFVLYDTGSNDPGRILALGDRELLLELCKDTIYGDGTFDKVPAVFYQLYTWHAKVGNSYPPCVYFLLLKKNLETYMRMFEILKELVPNIAPQKVLVDFEKACMNAARIAFPDAAIKGCYFHLCQSLLRKINSVGLKSDYECNVEVKLTLKSLAALAFVPVNDVRDLFDRLAATFPNEASYNDILTYYFSTYIEGAVGRDPSFPIPTWNHYDAALDQSQKTTNCCEGFHNALNSLFHCSHPSMWFLFDGLMRDLACHKLTLVNAQLGRPEVKKRKYDRLHQLVASAVQMYELHEDKLQYLRRLSNLQ